MLLDKPYKAHMLCVCPFFDVFVNLSVCVFMCLCPFVCILIYGSVVIVLCFILFYCVFLMKPFACSVLLDKPYKALVEIINVGGKFNVPKSRFDSLLKQVSTHSANIVGGERGKPLFQ